MVINAMHKIYIRQQLESRDRRIMDSCTLSQTTVATTTLTICHEFGISRYSCDVLSIHAGVYKQSVARKLVVSAKHR